MIDFGLSDADWFAVLKIPAGTRRYAAPELIGGKAVDCRADIYSLGCILKEMSPRYRKVAENVLPCLSQKDIVISERFAKH